MARPAVVPDRKGDGAPVIHHERGETVPPHGDVIRIDVRRPWDREPASAVLVAHGFKGFKDWGFFPYLCECLAEDGHLVVSFNFSLNGTGAGLLDFVDLDAFGRNTLTRELEDLRWMMDQLAAGVWTGGRSPGPIGLLGHSRGGGTSIIAAAEWGAGTGPGGDTPGQGCAFGPAPVSALVTWAAVSTFYRWTREQEEEWTAQGVTYIANARTGQNMPLYRSLRDDLRENRKRLDVLGAASRVLAPWLVVHGPEDVTVPLAEARALAAAGRTAELQVVEGSGHTFNAGHPMEAPPPGLKAALRVTRHHFRTYLLDHTEP